MSCLLDGEAYVASRDCLFFDFLNPIRDAAVNRDLSFWLIQGPGWLLTLYLVYAQAIPAFDYQTGVSMGTQEPVEVITGVGVAFWYGFAFGDLVAYIPMLALGLIGCWIGKHWGQIILASAMGISIYWPIVCLAAVASARNAPGWNLQHEAAYWVVLPLISLWGAWGVWRLARSY
jgi:hypothetical protein